MSIQLPKSAMIVLARLTSEGPMTPKDIIEKVKLAPRTVSFALRRLTRQNLCRRVHNLNDMRQPYYCPNVKRMRELQINIDHWQMLSGDRLRLR